MHLIMSLALLLLMSGAYAGPTVQDLLKLKNDKEVMISSFNESEKTRIQSKFNDNKTNTFIMRSFYSAVFEYVNAKDKVCEFRLIDSFKSKLSKSLYPVEQEDMEDYFKMMRVANAIDDVFYDILMGINTDLFNLKELDLESGSFGIIFPHDKLLQNNDLKDLFGSFKTWPDEKKVCSYQSYVYLKNNIYGSDNKKSTSKTDLKNLISDAFKQKIISQESFVKLEYLRTKSFVNNRILWLDDYFKIIFKAKNKMVPKNYNYKVKVLSEENGFSSERIKRFSRLTRRKLLYKKYDETQIILLAQALQKASKRMGMDPDTKTKAPVISQEFSFINETGAPETYVEKIELDPQSQYNLARRLLRKDILELQMMDIFNKLTITYEDVVMAAFETGYISFEDIEYVVKYDDLWNASKTQFEKIMGFVWTVAGFSTFYMPPPWNVTGAIAIGVIEGLVDSKHKNGAENDNPATFIE